MKKILCFLFILNLVACDKDAVNNSQVEEKVSGNNALLENNSYKSDCTLINENKNSQYEIITFAEASFTKNIVNFDDTNCLETNKRASIIYTLINFKKAEQPAKDGWIRYNYKYQSIVAKPELENITEDWNQNSAYGYQNWITGKAKDVSGLKYTANSDKLNSKGDSGFRYFKIEGKTLSVFHNNSTDIKNFKKMENMSATAQSTALAQ